MTPLEDLRKSDLEHYDRAATKECCWHNTIPRAINFYYDYRQMSLWKRLLQALKTE